MTHLISSVSATRVTDQRTSVRLNRVGSRFQSFGINDLEMVDQTGVSWNHLAVWLIRVGGLAATRSLPARVTSSTVIARLPAGT